MDFVTGLPRTQRQHDAIWVIVDRLTKSAHFLPVNVEDSLEKLAQLYVHEIVSSWGSSFDSFRSRPHKLAQLYKWLHLRHYMVGNVELQCAGMRLVRED